MIHSRFSYLFIIILITISCRNNRGEIEINPNDSNNIVAAHDSIVQRILLPSLISFKQSKCKTKCALKEEILNANYNQDTLFLKIASIQECVVNYSAAIDSFKNDTLFLKIANKMNEGTLCYCLYYFDFAIKNLKSMPKMILVNGHKIYRNFEFTPPVIDTFDM